MSKSPQNNSVQKTHDVIALPFVRGTPEGRKFWHAEPADYGEGCELGSEYAVAYLNYLKKNDSGLGLLDLITSHMGHEEYNSEKLENTRGHKVGFLSFLDTILKAASEHFDFEGYHAERQQSWDNYKAAEKKVRSDRARKAAMVRWHGKDSQAVKSL